MIELNAVVSGVVTYKKKKKKKKRSNEFHRLYTS